MRYDMNLASLPFQMMKARQKTIELRLKDEKRKNIATGDFIFFHLLNDEYQVIKTKVKQVYCFQDFAKLYQSLPLEKCGYRKEELPGARPEDMLEYYSIEQQQKYGVLGIEIEVLEDDYLIDGHMHLEYGPLSKEYVMEFVNAAVSRGLDEIDILDHSHRFKEFESCYTHLKVYPEQAAWLSQATKFCNTLDEYQSLIDEIRKMDLPVKVKFGLEVCYTSDTEEMLREILINRHFDFLTGAVHSFHHILYDMSFSKKLRWESYPAEWIYDEYYQAVFDCIRSGLFDRLAHPDTIKLFQIYPEKDMTETYQLLSDLLKEYDMYGENNTGCHYRYHHPDVGLSDELLSVFKKNKVKIITASDAHHPEDVGSYIYEAQQRLKGETYGEQSL